MKVHLLSRLFLLVAVCTALMTASASADVITFDGLTPTDPAHPEWGGAVPGNYGSTALVAISYATTADPVYTNYGAVPYICWWPTYGDLSNVGYSANPFGTMLISFTPVAGYQVTLNGFDLGQDLDSSYGFPHFDVNPFYISDSAGPGFTFPFTQTNELVHSHFAPNYTTSGTLTLAVASTWDVGIDNIDFSVTRIPTPPPPPGESVPEPASLVLLGSGLLALARRCRK